MIAMNAPRASFAKPYVSQDEDGCITVKCGSPADASRMIDALRANGYSANTSPWNWLVVCVR